MKLTRRQVFNKLLISLILILCAFTAKAQDRTVNGKVTSADEGIDLAGVNVLVSGTNIGTMTDANGKYTIIIPEGGTTLLFSSIGYQSKSVPIEQKSLIDVQLVTDITQLSEVVITGYGSQLKQDLTAKIEKIDGKEIQYLPAPTFEQALQGRAAGVYINSQSGKLGQAISVRIRGNSSISASNQPLYVLDGVPLTTDSQTNYGGATNPLIDLNPNDIESIEILKDAAAGAIYGSRAANGVVLISTKKGKAGATSVILNYQTGYSESTRRVSFLNSEQYAELLLEGAKYIDDDNGTPIDDPTSETTYVKGLMQYYSYGQWESDPQKTYEWQDVVFQKGAYRQADIQMSGGSENTKFFLSGQYLRQDGIIIGNKIERFTSRLNLENKVNPWLNIGLNMNFARTLNRRLPDDNQFSNPLQSVAIMPMTPSIDPETGLPAGTPPGDANIPLYYNPKITVDYGKYIAESYRNFSKAFANISITNNLLFQTEFGFDLLSQNEEGYFQSQTKRNNPNASTGLGNNNSAFVFNYNINNYFNYHKFSGNHDIGVTLGMQYQDSYSKYSSVQGTDFPSDSYRKIASAATISGGSSTETRYSFLSYFLRANYKFANKYLISFSGRIDGSSRFGDNNRYGFFPAVSGGWIISEEEFLKSISFLSFLKLRTSYGIVGNSEIGNFPQLGLYTGSADYVGTGGQAPSQIGNSDLKWETNKQLDIGFDIGLVNDRITLELDYYNRLSEDLLLNVNVPSTTGFNTVVKNLGTMENKGVELVINSQNLTGKLKWGSSFNIATNRGKVLNVQGQIIENGVGGLNRVMEGYNLGVFYTVEYAGVNPQNGDAQFYKNTQLPNGTINRTILSNAEYNEAERVVVGDPNPKFIAGLMNDLSYRNFDFSFLFSAVWGNDISVYGMGQFSMANMIYEDNQTVDQMNRWRNVGDITNVPQVRYYYGNGNQASSRFIVDGSFIRLRTATLGYSIPKSVLKRISIKSARFYLTGNNLLLFTNNYPLWDPEVNSDTYDTNISKGNDFYTPPQPRTFLVGVNIGF